MSKNSLEVYEKKLRKQYSHYKHIPVYTLVCTIAVHVPVWVFFFKTSIHNISHILTVRELFHIDFSTCIDISNVSYLSGGFSSSKNRDRSSKR